MQILRQNPCWLDFIAIKHMIYSRKFTSDPNQNWNYKI